MDLGAFSVSLAVWMPEIATRLEDAGIEFTARELPEGGGPAHVALVDPDGNSILIDQHR